jgi:hypothetical protein
MQGVILLALKRSAYSLGAFNLALSIKHHNPYVHITLVSDGEHLNNYRTQHFAVFDSIKEIKKEDYLDCGVFQPALAKLNIYKYSDNKGTLFIDADSICLKDIKPFLESLKGCKFKTYNAPDYGRWISEEDYETYFGAKYGVSINSSWYYWEDDTVFKKAKQFYDKQIPLESIKPSWGGAYPDELFFNLAVDDLKIPLGMNDNIMFFGKNIDPRSLGQLEDDFYFFTLFGNQTTVRKIYIDWYDRLMFRYCESKGIEHHFKSRTILTNKHLSR